MKAETCPGCGSRPCRLQADGVVGVRCGGRPPKELTIALFESFLCSPREAWPSALEALEALVGLTQNPPSWPPPEGWLTAEQWNKSRDFCRAMRESERLHSEALASLRGG